MTICSQCNKEYQDADTPCPHCSSDQSPQKKKTKLTKTTEDPFNAMPSGKGKMVTFNLSPKMIGIITLVVVVVGFIGGTMSEPDKETPSANNSSTTVNLEQSSESDDKQTFSMNETSGQKKATTREITVEDEINSVFVKISKANLDEDIDMFLRYYSDNFPNRADKKQKTLETWEKYDFLSLSFFVFDLNVNGPVADASVAWEISLQDFDGQPQVMETVNDVILNKGEEGWQITALK